MSVATLPVPDLVDTTGGDDIEHQVCCDDNVALCGADVSELVFLDEDEDEEGLLCALCTLVIEMGYPCPVPGCIGEVST